MSIDEIERRKAEITKRLEKLYDLMSSYDPILYADTDDPDFYEAVQREYSKQYALLKEELARLDEQTSGATPEHNTDDGEER